jgi:hypothetical protein
MDTTLPSGNNHPNQGSSSLDATLLSPDHELSFATDHEAGDMLEKAMNMLRLKAVINSTIHQPSSAAVSSAVIRFIDSNRLLVD